MNYQIDEQEVRRAWSLFMRPGQVTELRCLKCKLHGNRWTATYSGYFDNCDALLNALSAVESASGCYFVPNEVKPELMARAPNYARLIKDDEPKTGDRDILRRRWLLIDVDPVRPSGISSTIAEKAAAEGIATAIDYELWEMGFPAGIFADSGNGCHLMIPVDLPADDGGWCKKILGKLAKEFDTSRATIDVSVFNPARIWKLYGTLSCKGANCPDLGREWRMARVLQVCSNVSQKV